MPSLKRMLGTGKLRYRRGRTHPLAPNTVSAHTEAPIRSTTSQMQTAIPLKEGTPALGATEEHDFYGVNCVLNPEAHQQRRTAAHIGRQPDVCTPDPPRGEYSTPQPANALRSNAQAVVRNGMPLARKHLNRTDVGGSSWARRAVRQGSGTQPAAPSAVQIGPGPADLRVVVARTTPSSPPDMAHN